jgi:hypothetical protein
VTPAIGTAADGRLPGLATDVVRLATSPIRAEFEGKAGRTRRETTPAKRWA